MEKKNEKRKITVSSVLLIQAAVIIYTGSSICSKMAGMHKGSITVFGRTLSGVSLEGLLWLFLEVVCLGVYAIFWQQIIKHFDLSIAYANRAFAICWSTLWGILLFGETLKPLNVVGIALVLIGIIMVNQDAK